MALEGKFVLLRQLQYIVIERHNTFYFQPSYPSHVLQVTNVRHVVTRRQEEKREKEQLQASVYKQRKPT